MRHTPNRSSRRLVRAFSLIELLVVIAIIAILLGLVLVAGQRILSGGRERLTEDTLKVLESALSAYVAETGSIPPAFVRDPRATDPAFDDVVWPLADARNLTGGSDQAMFNSAGLFLAHAAAYPTVQAVVDGLPSESVALFSPSANPSAAGAQPLVSTPIDAWGNPIRFVHPAFDGLIHGGTSGPNLNNADALVNIRGEDSGAVAVGILEGATEVSLGAAPRGVPSGRLNFGIRRNNIGDNTGRTDSDGGVCTAQRPYFYSAGPDGDPATTEDNVYLNEPRFEQPAR